MKTAAKNLQQLQVSFRISII